MVKCLLCSMRAHIPFPAPERKLGGVQLVNACLVYIGQIQHCMKLESVTNLPVPGLGRLRKDDKQFKVILDSMSLKPWWTR